MGWTWTLGSGKVRLCCATGAGRETKKKEEEHEGEEQGGEEEQGKSGMDSILDACNYSDVGEASVVLVDTPALTLINSHCNIMRRPRTLPPRPSPTHGRQRVLLSGASLYTETMGQARERD